MARIFALNTARKKTAALFLIPALMFGFGYLMVPIYNVFCEWTGLNGKTGAIAAAEASRIAVDETRMVTVEFLAHRNLDAPLEFAAAAPAMQVHPGKTYQATYIARNKKDSAMTGQAVPSVSPSKAAGYFDKVECFCFTRQKFAPGERRELPLTFIIDPDLPRGIDTVTLAYTFFDVGAAHEKSEHAHAQREPAHGAATAAAH